MQTPDPSLRHPLPHAPQVAFLKAVVTRPNIVVGDYTYYDDKRGPERFETENVLHHYEARGDLLRIGRFCALATGTTFIMDSANHRMDGVSTFPFPIFGQGWGERMDLLMALPPARDTVVGHDVWFGHEALVMPGVTIGSGAIVAARSVVTRDVPPYAIVGGNPATVLKMRFPDDVIERLLALAWWDWPITRVTANLEAIMAGSVDELEAVSR
ncbi:MAG: CatB-related O-acetyltransferase [Pseudomonadota bacterium]